MMVELNLFYYYYYYYYYNYYYRLRRIFKQVKYSVISIELSHDLHACVNDLIHIDIFSGMYTSLGTGDIRVRMLGSWEKIMVDQRRLRRILKQVK